MAQVTGVLSFEYGTPYPVHCLECWPEDEWACWTVKRDGILHTYCCDKHKQELQKENRQ